MSHSASPKATVGQLILSPVPLFDQAFAKATPRLDISLFGDLSNAIPRPSGVPGVAVAWIRRRWRSRRNAFLSRSILPPPLLPNIPGRLVPDRPAIAVERQGASLR
jgi:hypothetical protein